jgi:hypothetical protein
MDKTKVLGSGVSLRLHGLLQALQRQGRVEVAKPSGGVSRRKMHGVQWLGQALAIALQALAQGLQSGLVRTEDQQTLPPLHQDLGPGRGVGSHIEHGFDARIF